MKWMQVQKILMTHGVKILAAMLGAGVIGTAAVQSRMDDNAFSPSGHSRAILQNEVVYPGEEERTRANGEGDGKDAWEKAEELLEEKLAQSDEADSALFDESRIAGRIEDANVLVGDFEDDLSDRKDRGTDRASKQNAHGQLDGRSVYVRDNNAQDGSPVIPALNRDRIVGRTGDNAADDGRTGKNGVTTGRNDSRRSTGTSETSNGGTEYSGYDRRQRSDNAEAASADDRTRAITPAIDPSKPVVKTPEEERIERLREEYKQYDFVIPESHPANIGYTTSISEKRLARMEEDDGKGAVVTISEVDNDNPRKFTTADVLDAATILYAYDVKLDYVTINQSDQRINRLTSYQIDNPDLENVKVVIKDVFDDKGKKTHSIVQVIVNYGHNNEYTASGEMEIELYDERVIFVDADGKEIGSRYYKNNEECVVNEYDSPIYGPRASVEPSFMEGDEQYISELCEGVSDTPNGELIDRFIVSPEGRIDGKRVLYVKKNYKVPDNWRIKRDYSDELSEEDRYFAVLCSTGDSEKDVVVPPGIEVIRGEIKAKSLTISSEVQKIDLSNAVVKEAFHVSEDSPYFSVTEDGLLTDKAGKTLYGVPAEKKETIVIPAEVEEIACNFADGQTVQFTGDEQPKWQDNQEDMKQNRNLKIVLPKDSYLEYLRKWRMDETAMSNVYIEGETASLADQKIFVEQDGAVVQRIEGEKNKLRLLRIPDGIYKRGAYVVPDTVEVIAAGAIPEGEPLGLLIVPDSVKEIDASILYDQNVKDYIYLMHENSAPEIVIDGGSTGLTGKKLTEIKVLNEEIQQKLADFNKDKNVTENKGEIIVYNGNVYDVQEPYKKGQLPSLLLRRANPAATTFCEEEDVPAGYELIMVNSNAFANCKNLRTVEFPETTTMILENAFDGCSNLEGVLAKATGTIYMMQDVFKGCDNLRFFAANTDNSSVYFADEQDKQELLKEKEGFEELNILYTSDYFSTPVQYSLEKANEGVVLLATEDLSMVPDYSDWHYDTEYDAEYTDSESPDISSENNDAVDNNEPEDELTAEDEELLRILVATTTNISGTVELHGAQIIAKQAFAGCTLPFHINADDWANVYQFTNEAFKNATGFNGVTVEGIAPDGFVPIGEGVEFEISEGKSIGTYLVVGNQVFENCTGIRHVEISMGSMGDYAVYESEDENKEYEIEAIPPRIEIGLFQGCNNLETITFVPGSNGKSYIDQISFGAFSGTKATKIYLPDSITHIQNQAFGESLEQLDFTGKVIVIDNNNDDDQADDADENEGDAKDENEEQEVSHFVKYIVPELFGQSYDNTGDRLPFYFKEGNQETANDFKITFNRGMSGDECPEVASQFLQQWRYNMLGYSSAKDMLSTLYSNVFALKNGDRFESLRKEYGKQINNPEDSNDAELSEEERSEKLEQETIQLLRAFVKDKVTQTENKLKNMMGITDKFMEVAEAIGYIGVEEEVDEVIRNQGYKKAKQTYDMSPNLDLAEIDEEMLEDSLVVNMSDGFDASEMLEEMKTSMVTDTYLEETESNDDEVQPERAESESEFVSSEKVEAEEPVSSDQPETDENIVEDEKSETIESDSKEDDEAPIEEDADAAEEVEEITTDTVDVEDAELAEEITADDTVLDTVDDDFSDENLTETADEVASEAIEEPEADISTQDAEAVTNESETVVEPVNDSSEPDSAEETGAVEEPATTED